MSSSDQSQNRCRRRRSNNNNSTAAAGHHQQHQPMSKPSPKILSLILRTIIMSLLTSLFFLFLGLAAIFLLHLFLVGRHLHRHRRRQQQQQQQHHSQSQSYLSSSSSFSGISLDDIHSLPEFICSNSTALVSESECVICLDQIRDGDLFRILPGCSHAFHLDCIDTWLVNAPACPICRARVCSGSGTGADQGKQQQLWDVRA